MDDELTVLLFAVLSRAPRPPQLLPFLQGAVVLGLFVRGDVLIATLMRRPPGRILDVLLPDRQRVTPAGVLDQRL